MAAPFGTLLRQYRRRAGLTQTRLAELSGVSAQAISMLERGTRMFPRHDTVTLLVKALGVRQEAAEALRTAAARPSAVAPESRLSDIGESVAPRDRTAPPRWLPPAVGDFTGREDELAQLTSTLSSAPQSPAVVLASIEGMGGIGKTTLAVRAAHQVADEFPDGQLYIDLRGFGPGDPMSTAAALSQLLGTLGVAEPETGTVEEASGRFRSALAGQRILVVLDNAADVDQVGPLLPGTAGCAAILTSRQSLAGLPGSHHLHLDVLSMDDGIALLRAIVGDDRVNAEPAAAADVVRRCGQLPLAIRMLGARLTSRPGWPISVMATQLTDERRRLNELELRDAGVRVSFAASLRGLAGSDDQVDASAATSFPLLGVLDCSEVGLEVSARLIDRPFDETGRIMERLVDFHLLETPSPGRYRMHDLLRSYIREYAASHLADGERGQAIVRVLRLYNTIAWRDFEVANPTHVRLRYRKSEWIDEMTDLELTADDAHWLIEERENLVSAIQQGSANPAVSQQLIAQLALASLQHTNDGGYWRQLLSIGRASLHVAAAAGDVSAVAFAHHDIGAAFAQLGKGAKSVEEMRIAVGLFQEIGDLAGEAMVWCNMAYALAKLGRITEGIVAGERALDLSASRGLKHVEATTCLALGLLHGHSGDRALELDYHERSRTIYEEIDYDRGYARALFNIGAAHQAEGRRQEAELTFLDAVRLCDHVGLIDTAGEARTNLADVVCATGRYEEAARLCREALAMALRVGSEMAEARARHGLGNALGALNQTDEARSEWLTARVIYERLDAPAALEIRHLLAASE